MKIIIVESCRIDPGELPDIIDPTKKALIEYINKRMSNKLGRTIVENEVRIMNVEYNPRIGGGAHAVGVVGTIDGYTGWHLCAYIDNPLNE